MLAASAAGVLALAGCSALGEDDADPGPDPFRLGRIRLENALRTPHEIGLRVDRDGERVHLRTYRLDAAPAENRVRNRAVPVEEFGCRPGRYELAARLDGDEWTPVTLPAAYAGHLVELEVRDGGDGPSLGQLVETNAPRWSRPGTGTTTAE